MGLTRRELLKLAGGSVAGAAVIAACRPAVREYLAQSPSRLPEDLATGIDNWYATLCRECGSGCGTIVRVIEGRAKKIEGNPLHPVNAGRLCARGQAGVQALYHPDRVRRPMKAAGARGSGSFQEISWDEALNTLVAKLKENRGAGASRVLLVTEPLSGHLGGLTVRFASSFGAVHVPFEPLDQTVLHRAIQHVYGQDLIPLFDIANARYLLSFGADFLGGWVSQVQHSRAYGHFRQGGPKRGTFVAADSRFSTTAANADEWLPVRPGQEGKLALAIAYVIVKDGRANAQALAALTGGRGLAALEPFSPERVAEATGIPARRIEEVARAFSAADHQPALAIGGGSAGATSNGLFNLTAVYALNLLAGNAGKAGGVIFNPPPPIGGPLFTRDAPFAPARATPLAEMRRAIDAMRAGQVNALLVRNADLVHDLPGALGAADAVQKVPFIASLSSFLDDTTYQADLVLPTHLGLEDWGDGFADPGPGYEALGFQQPVVNPFHESRGFGDLLLVLAQELGMERDLPWQTFRDVLREGAQRLQQLGRGSVSGASFEAYWNDLLRQGGWQDKGKVSAAAPRPQPLPLDRAEAEFAGAAGAYPYHLVPFESIGIGDGRGAHLPWLQATPDPLTTATWTTWVEVNKKTAEGLGLREGDIVTIESPTGRVEAAVYPNPATPPWVLGVPLGQGHRALGRYAEGRGDNVLKAVSPQTEAETGALAWAATRVKMTPAGRRIRIPKFENSYFPIDFDHKIVQITKKD